jgi:hypothetical protein
MPEFPVDVLRMPQEGAAPGGVAGSGKLYTKSVLGVAQSHYQASDNAETQLTNAALTDGSVPYSSLKNILNLNTKTLLLQTAAQGIFDSSIDAVTLLANTTYLIRGMFCLRYVSTVTYSVSSVIAGTATYTTFTGSMNQRQTQVMQYNVVAQSKTTHILSAATTQIVALTSSGTRDYFFNYQLIAVVNAGGTIIPSISCSAVPASGSLIRLASLEIIPLGSNTFTAQNWT